MDSEVILSIGRVVRVEGREVEIQVKEAKNSAHLFFQGEVINNVSVGGHVRIAKGFSSLVAKVEGEKVVEVAGNDSGYKSRLEKIDRRLTVNLVGYFEDGKFRRGVREMPLVDNECFLLTQFEFDRIHTWKADDDVPIAIGTLAMEKGRPVNIGINMMFANHIGIFGNTGSGKSYSLARLYRAYLNQAVRSARF